MIQNPEKPYRGHDSGERSAPQEICTRYNPTGIRCCSGKGHEPRPYLGHT